MMGAYSATTFGLVKLATIVSTFDSSSSDEYFFSCYKEE
jgi:hypothetical protein